MKKLRTGQLVLALTTAVIAVAGCGGSSKPAGNTNAPPAGTTAGTGTSVTASPLPPSTKINSPAYRAFAERGLAQIPGVTASAIPRIIDCVVQKQLSQGITTVGAVKTHRSQVNADGVACAHQAGLK